MDNRSGILDPDRVGNVEGVVTTRATFTEAELARADRVATKAGKVALVTRAGIALVDPATLPLDVRDERDEFSDVRMK